MNDGATAGRILTGLVPGGPAINRQTRPYSILKVENTLPPKSTPFPGSDEFHEHKTGFAPNAF